MLLLYASRFGLLIINFLQDLDLVIITIAIFINEFYIINFFEREVFKMTISFFFPNMGKQLLGHSVSV